MDSSLVTVACRSAENPWRAGVLTGGALLASALCLAGCGSEAAEPRSLSVDFELHYGARVVGCGDVLEGVGVTASRAELLDARIYLHDVRALLADGSQESVELEASEWQRDGLILLDFADDTGLCETGSPETNRTLRGRLPDSASGAPLAGLAFRIGLPDDMNHIDAARSPAPLNAPGMAWSWVAGFKYARIDLRTEGNEAWYVHLGATGCEGTPATGIQCAFGNLSEVQVQGLDAAHPRIRLDLEPLYQDSDVDAKIDQVTDFVPGCMAFGGDPECPAIFDALGLTFESHERAEQRVFTAE